MSIAESEYTRPVSRVAKTSAGGRDGFFYGLADEPLKKGDKRQTTIQSKHVTRADEKKLILASRIPSFR